MSDWLVYLANSAAWSLVGFVGGWLLATVGRDVKDIREAVMHDEEAPVAEPPVHHVEAQVGRSDTATRWLGIVVALLAIVTVAQALYLNRKQAEVVECQTNFNNTFSEVSTLRSKLANEDRLALQNMLLALYRQRGADEARRLETFREWVTTVERNEREREANPLPALPHGDCK